MNPLNNVALERAFAAYLTACFEDGEVTTPAPAGEATVARATPPVICFTAGDVIPVNQSFVAVNIPDTPPDMAGVYGEKLRVTLVVSTPFPFPPGIAQADHGALAAALEACFPARPHIGATDYETKLAAWEDLNDALSDEVLEKTGYVVNGWHVEGSRSARADKALEAVLTVRPCIYHPSLV